MSYRCTWEGCGLGPETDDVALFRISPKGGPFVGMCAFHFGLVRTELEGAAEAMPRPRRRRSVR